MSEQLRVNAPSGKRGFTVVEVVVAMMIMTIAVLALASSSGLVAKMLLRGHNAEMASAFATRRIDDLRLSACTARANGADTLFRGTSNWAAINNWVWTDATGGTYRVKVTTTYRSSNGATGTNVSETSISCVF
jgi:prepilin-type N-terminal cleavage/methylation domain-containing protein